MATLIEQFKNLTRYWWGLLILGVALFIVGIMVFTYPGESYVGMAALFAVLMLVSGVMQVVMAFTEKYMTGRGWSAVVGILEIILGIVLMFSPAISAMILPVILGIWLLVRGLGLIGISAEMQHLKVTGMGWTIMLAILLIICSLMILFQPLLFGVAAVIIWVGIAFLVAGVSMVVFAFQLFSFRNKAKKFVG